MILIEELEVIDLNDYIKLIKVVVPEDSVLTYNGIIYVDGNVFLQFIDEDLNVINKDYEGNFYIVTHDHIEIKANES